MTKQCKACGMEIVPYTKTYVYNGRHYYRDLYPQYCDDACRTLDKQYPGMFGQWREIVDTSYVRRPPRV